MHAAWAKPFCVIYVRSQAHYWNKWKNISLGNHICLAVKTFQASVERFLIPAIPIFLRLSVGHHHQFFERILVLRGLALDLANRADGRKFRWNKRPKLRCNFVRIMVWQVHLSQSQCEFEFKNGCHARIRIDRIDNFFHAQGACLSVASATTKDCCNDPAINPGPKTHVGQVLPQV